MNKKLFIPLLAAVILFALVVPSLGWFGLMIEFDNEPVMSGSSAAAYFGGGDGKTQESAFIISSPIHLYNLAWLQYIGYFNKGPSNNGLTQTYFKLTDNIDMTGITLPPIGTTQYPFLGVFDGCGYVISNLKTANKEDIIEKYPTSAQFTAQFDVADLLSIYKPNTGEASVEVGNVMGLFGVIGDYNNASEKVGQSSSELALIAAKNFGITNYTLISSSKNTTVGFVAGYVNATLENVLVGNCALTTPEGATAVTLDSSSNNTLISEHTLVGYCTDGYEETVKNTVVSIYDPKFSELFEDINGVGKDSNWGGSVAMKDLYTNLNALRNDPTTATPNYAYTAVKVTNADGTAVCAVDRGITSGFMFSDSYKIKDTHSVVFSYGSLFLSELTMLSGGAMINGTVVCTKSTNTVTAQYIKYGNDFLNVEVDGGAPTITLGKDESSATKWVLSDGKLAVLTNGIKLYVDVSETNIQFTIDPDGATSNWSYVDATTTNGTTVKAKGLCYTSGTKEYYLKLINDKWELREEEDTSAYYVISSGNNYMVLTDTPHYYGLETGTYTTNDPNDPEITRWYMTNVDSYYAVYAYTDKEYYLFQYEKIVGNPNSGLYDAAQWTYDETNQRLYNNDIYTGGYLAYSNGTWYYSTNASDSATVTKVTPTVEVTPDWSRSDNMTVNDIDIGTKSGNITYEFGVANKHDATYIPLQTNDDNTPDKISNTGYLTGGMYNPLYGAGIIKPPDGNAEFDVWISEFYKENISTPGEVQALIWGNGSGSFIGIDVPTAYIDGKPSTALTGDAAKLSKYADSVYEYYHLLNSEDTSRLYGLQFIEGTMEARITIPEAYINGTKYIDFEVPSDCIDFNVKQKGYINFYAGTYYPGTSCFFSLHQVFRYTQQDKDDGVIPNGKKVNDIKEIKEIKRIYSVDGQNEYIYLYDEKTAAPANSTLVFDTKWLTEPSNLTAQESKPNGFQSSDISGFRGETYYFEIPVNAGEYALGSVEGKTGATLLYLDIGASLQDASSQLVERTVIEEIFVEDNQNYYRAKGVGVVSVENGGITTAAIPVSFALEALYGTDISIVRNDTDLTLSSENAAKAILNTGGGLKVTADDYVILNNSSSSGARNVTKRVTYIDDNKTTNTKIITIAELVFADLDSDGALDDGETYTVTVYSNGVEITPVTTSSGVTSFKLSHRVEEERIEWNNITTDGRELVSEYNYSPATGITVTNDIVLDHDTKAYTATVSADSGSTTVTVTHSNGATVTAGENITVDNSP